MAKYSENQNKHVQKYIKNHYDNIVVRVPKGDREKYKELASQKGVSLNQLIVDFLERL